VRKPIVPHHPVHHGPVHHGSGGGGRHGRGGSGGPPKKPHPPSKAHKKPKPPAKPKRPPARKPVRKWSPGDVACCSAEAVGLLLGLSDAEVLDLYWLTADDPDEGASIEDTLTAAGCLASWVGLNGVTPAAAPLILGIRLEQPHAVAVTPDGTWWSWGQPWQPPPGLVIEEAWCLP
jgi:hypothetical protein